jgi:peptidoglycan-associated lipoprotein
MLKISFLSRSLFLFFVAASLHAQSRPLEVSVTYTAARSLKAATSQDFWMQGGSMELATDVWKGFGIAVDITGLHTNSVGSGGVPLSLITATFGPRYRWHPSHRVSLYSQVLTGEANGFDSVFPTPSGVDMSANSLALQMGGGMDYHLSSHLAFRVVDAEWLRTQLPNGTNNIQNTLRLGAGVVFRFGSEQ